jgi:hypothetical protein
LLGSSNTLTLNGSFLKMTGGTLTADSFIQSGGVGSTLIVNSAVPFVDLTNATVTLTNPTSGSVDIGSNATVTLAPSTPILRMNNSSFTMASGDLSLAIGEGRSFGTSTGALALVATNGSTLTQNEGGLVDFEGGGAATTTATAPLVQLTNSTVNLNQTVFPDNQHAMVHVQGAGTVGTINGPLLSATNSRIDVTGDGNLLWVDNGATLTRTGAGTGATFQFTGGALNVTSETILIRPGATLALNNPLISATGTAFNLGTDIGFTDAVLRITAESDIGVGTLTSTTTSPLLSFNGGSLATQTGEDLIHVGRDQIDGAATLTTAGPLLSLQNIASGNFTVGSGTLLHVSGGASVTLHGILDMTDTNLSLSGPLVKLETGSTLTALSGPVLRMNGGTLSADSLIITDSTFNSFSTTGPLMDLTNATVTMRVIGDEQATSVFVDSFSLSLGVNEPLLRLNGSSLTFTQINQDGFDLSPNGEGLGIQSGVTLIATNGSTFTTGSALLSLENITYTDSNPQIQLSNSTLTTTGARNLIEAIHSTPMVTGPLLTATDSTLNLSGGLLSVEPGAQLTTPTTSALVTLTGGTHTVATNTGAALFDVKGAPFTTQTVDGLLLELGTSPAVHGGTVAAPAALSASLLQTSGATVSTGTAVRVDTALLEATAPLIQALANSNVAVSGGAAFQVGTRATLRNSGSATSSVVFLDGSTFRANGGPLFNLTGVGGSYLHTVAGDLLFLTNGSVLDVTSLTNGFLISAAGSSVVDINGALVRFGTNVGNSVIVRNAVVPTDVIPVGGFNFPVVLTGGAQLSQITIQGTPVKNLASNTITLTNSGSLFAIDGAGARITIRGN